MASYVLSRLEVPYRDVYVVPGGRGAVPRWRTYCICRWSCAPTVRTMNAAVSQMPPMTVAHRRAVITTSPDDPGSLSGTRKSWFDGLMQAAGKRSSASAKSGSGGTRLSPCRSPICRRPFIVLSVLLGRNLVLGGSRCQDEK